MSTKYYSLINVSSPKIIGVNNGVMQIEICDSVFLSNYYKALAVYFEDKDSRHIFASHKEYISSVNIVKNAKMTDFLTFGPNLYCHNFIVSSKVMRVLKAHNVKLESVTPIKLESNKKNLNDYCLISMYPFDLDIIDFEKSVLYDKSLLFPERKRMHITSEAEYWNFQETYGWFGVDKIVLNKSFDQSIDMFFTRTTGFFVSQRLKDAFDRENVTGINISDKRRPVLEVN